MGTRRTTQLGPDPTEHIEMLRSRLVAEVVASALDWAAKSDDVALSAPATADILATSATELRDWHAKPRHDAARDGIL